MPSPINPDDRTCLLLALPRLSDSEQAELAGLIAGERNWAGILEQSVAHQVFPLVGRNLESRKISPVQGRLAENFRALCNLNAVQSDLLSKQLTQVLVALHEASVPVAPVKGVWLGERLYGDRHLRAGSDLDILVPHHAVPRALSVLQSIGYLAKVPSWRISEFMMRHSMECELRREDRAIANLIDLHWSFAVGSKRQSMADVWASSQETVFRGTPARALTCEWELIFLLIHAARHQWQGLKWMIDIHLLSQASKIDWDRLTRDASLARWDHVVRWGLSICHATLGTPFPKELQSEPPRFRVRQFPETPQEPTP